MTNVRLSLPSVFALVAIASAAAFAVGKSMAPPAAEGNVDVHFFEPAARGDAAHRRQPGAAARAPPTGGADPMGAQPLPPGHPAVDPLDPTGSQMNPSAAGTQSSLEYKAPARWVLVPNASTMRLATYRVPRAPGDTEDAELSITQAGGSVEANADRWVGQFDAASQKTAKRSTRNVGALAVTIVEVQGKFEGGMGKDGGAGWALLGAIVATPGDAPFLQAHRPRKDRPRGARRARHDDGNPRPTLRRARGSTAKTRRREDAKTRGVGRGDAFALDRERSRARFKICLRRFSGNVGATFGGAHRTHGNDVPPFTPRVARRGHLRLRRARRVHPEVRRRGRCGCRRRWDGRTVDSAHRAQCPMGSAALRGRRRIRRRGRASPAK